MNSLWGLTVRGICEVDGEILLLKISPEAGHDTGRWEIPGGKVKRGEYFDEALKREYLEETGLKINVESLYNTIQNNYRACKTDENIKSVQLIMKVTSKTKDVTISREHVAYQWFGKDEIKQMCEDNLLTDAAVRAFKRSYDDFKQ